ncbi:response regulator [Gorillibacterium massiliense]|uniref:response regulator n=1 Tax=Gorillibacterium massiliense TaxID=1280390 RepID=UPI0004AE8309|nr:response regulator [Gorillibacterium massiliense]
MNILLVDDEEYVLDYLEETMDWEHFGITRVFRAGSADEAIAIANRESISIMITDIRMPGQSGLELLGTMSRVRPETKVILLSGYSDFDYAKTALRKGAVDYLLKPVTSDEVASCLTKITSQIQKEHRNQQALTEAIEVLKLAGPRLREHLLLDLLLGGRFSDPVVNEKLHTLHIQLQTGDPCMLALIRIETGNAELSREDIELYSYAVQNMADEIYLDHVEGHSHLWWCKDSHQFLALILPVDALGGVPAVLQRTELLRQAVPNYLKKTISIRLSQPFPFGRDVHSQYLQAINEFWRCVGTQHNQLLLTDQTDNVDVKPLKRLHESPPILQLMEQSRWDEVVERLETVLDELDTPPYRTQHHLVEAVYYLYSCFSYMAHKQGDSLSEMIGDISFLQDPFSFQSTAKVRSWALTLIEQFRVRIQETAGNQSRIISHIQAYIEEHLHEDVSLTKVGEYMYLHPVYLSRLYKKETGESLSSYITRMRMEKAAHLLRSTNKKVSDIAEEVGYHKTQYFIRLFKETYECTPQTFRNR